MSGQVLSERALNRALLARQLLLERRQMSALEALHHLVGMQSQAPGAPYVGLWTRLKGFQPEELSADMEARRAVRIVLMRSTIFVATAEDALALRPVMQPVTERAFESNWAKRLAGVDVAPVLDAARALVEERPRSWSELGTALAKRWPAADPEALAYVGRTYLALVQVTPRGMWGRSGAARHTTLEAWLGREQTKKPSVEDAVLRYLAAFGPATARDAQVWSGLTRLGEVFERLRPRLATFRTERGAELFDLPDAPRPDPDTPAPVRFLPEFENVLLSHDDRTRIFPDAYRKGFMTVNGLMRGTVLMDGFVCATWKVLRARKSAKLSVECFREFPAKVRRAISAEGERLMALTDPGASSREIEFGSIR
jgi:hypothetical protein